jgi:lipopolysaccharide export system permease protein
VLLHRLLFREILTPLLLSLLLVSLLLIVLQMLSLNEVLFGSGFDPGGVFRVASYLAPHFGIIAIPLAFLLAIMLGLGRLADDNELIALGSLGRSPAALYLVPVLMSVGLGAAVAQIAFVGEPWGLKGIHHQLNELIKRNVAGDVRPNTFSEDIPRFTIYVGSTSNGGADWHRVFLHDSIGDGAPLLMLAQQGKIETRGSDNMLRLLLDDGELHRVSGDGGYSRLTFADGTVALDVGGSIHRKNMFNRPNGELLLWQMPPAIRAARQAGDEGEARRISAQYYGRLAAPFTCLIFGLIGVPLAATARKSRGASFGATLFAFIGYYVLQTLGNGLGETGKWPAIAGANLPNAVGLAVALALGWRLRNGLQVGGSR